MRRLLLDYTKLKKETEPYVARKLYIHGSTMLNNIAQSLRLAGSSPLGLDLLRMQIPVAWKACEECFFIKRILNYGRKRGAGHGLALYTCHNTVWPMHGAGGPCP